MKDLTSTAASATQVSNSNKAVTSMRPAEGFFLFYQTLLSVSINTATDPKLGNYAIYMYKHTHTHTDIYRWAAKNKNKKTKTKNQTKKQVMSIEATVKQFFNFNFWQLKKKSFSLLVTNPAFICLAAVCLMFGETTSPSLLLSALRQQHRRQHAAWNKAAVSPPTGEKYFNWRGN